MGELIPMKGPTASTTTESIWQPPQASNLVQPVSGYNAPGTAIRIAALNEPYTGDSGGIHGADYACYRQAQRAGLRSTFRAMLSSTQQNLDSIVRRADRSLPVVNTHGELMFHSWRQMFDGRGALFAQTPRIFSFSGKDIMKDPKWPQKVAWHGSSLRGELVQNAFCDAWHSASASKVGLAGSLLSHQLLKQERYSCDNRFVLLCVEATTQLARRRRSTGEYYGSLNTRQADSILNQEEYEALLDTILDDRAF